MATFNSSVSFLWEYYSLGQKEWILFDYAMASTCEDAFTKNIKSIHYSLPSNNEYMYEINFEIMKQVNKNSGYIRSIRRRELVGDHVELFKNFAKDSLKLVSNIYGKVHTDIDEANEWTKYSAVTNVLPRYLFKHFCKHIKSLDRAVGSIVGMAVGDAVGAPLEFADVMNGDGVNHSSYYFSLSTKLYNRELNSFKIKRGQWTDDAAMGFCMADSILSCGGHLDGSDCRARFHTWWHYGYCNAFRKEKDLKHSIGLGGNIAKSLKDCVPGVIPSETFQEKNEDAGNGSLMRLAPIPVAFHSNIVLAREKAALSSYTTHPGPLAAECCALMSHIIVSAIHTSHTDIREFLDEMVSEYLYIIQDTNKNSDSLSKIERLLKCEELDTSTELCWNWKMESLDIWHTIKNRGSSYNDYPVLPGYFGSFCMDGLAIALWSLYHTTSFDEAIERCVNVLGDADSTGSIAGQIAGAFYGYSSISPEFCNNLEKWDDGDAVVRGALLYYINDK